MSFKEYIIEGQNEDQTKAILGKAGRSELYEPLLTITSNWKNSPQGRNNKHLRQLAFIVLNEPIDLAILKKYYDRWMNNPKLNSKPFVYKNFGELEQAVDSVVSMNKDIKSQEITDESIYEDENIKVFIGSDKEKCIKYGQGKKYGFCISRLDGSNLYHGYRGRGATFYFVYFKNDEAKNGKLKEGAELIVIHVYDNGHMMVNYAIPNADRPIEPSELLKEFPVLKPAFNIFKYRPFSDEEKRAYTEIKNTKSILDLKSLDDQLIYIELGKELAFHDWAKLGERLEPILKKYIEVGMFDVPREILARFPKYKERYDEMTGRRLEANAEQLDVIKDGEYEKHYAESEDEDLESVWANAPAIEPELSGDEMLMGDKSPKFIELFNSHMVLRAYVCHHLRQNMIPYIPEYVMPWRDVAIPLLKQSINKNKGINANVMELCKKYPEYALILFRLWSKRILHVKELPDELLNIAKSVKPGQYKSGKMTMDGEKEVNDYMSQFGKSLREIFRL